MFYIMIMNFVKKPVIIISAFIVLCAIGIFAYFSISKENAVPSVNKTSFEFNGIIINSQKKEITERGFYLENITLEDKDVKIQAESAFIFLKDKIVEQIDMKNMLITSASLGSITSAQSVLQLNLGIPNNLLLGDFVWRSNKGFTISAALSTINLDSSKSSTSYAFLPSFVRMILTDAEVNVFNQNVRGFLNIAKVFERGQEVFSVDFSNFTLDIEALGQKKNLKGNLVFYPQSVRGAFELETTASFRFAVSFPPNYKVDGFFNEIIVRFQDNGLVARLQPTQSEERRIFQESIAYRIMSRSILADSIGARQDVIRWLQSPTLTTLKFRPANIATIPSILSAFFENDLGKSEITFER